MGEDLKKYVIIERFNLGFNNRGNSALCYGAISFLEKYHNLLGHELLNYRLYSNPFKHENTKIRVKEYNIQGKIYTQTTIPVNKIEYTLFVKYGIRLPFTKFGKSITKIDYLASDYGGDGFSDIYSEPTFYRRLTETNVAVRAGRPLIILPQTIGPFKSDEIYSVAKKILRYAYKIYTRDNKFDSELKKLGIDYQVTNDLSAFMVPEPFDINIDKQNSVGLNVSGLAYSGGWHDLKGQFENYPYLINKIIKYFTSIGKTVYLIPHSYNYKTPEINNDDIVACREAYNSLEDKKNVVFIDRDLTAPQIKYVISQMTFFIGTRMHANFAAIFTKVPLFGLAYSYKFEGAFKQNGIENRTAMINNITSEQADEIVKQIVAAYLEDTSNPKH